MINETKTTEGFLMLDLWRKFELVELTEIMRQEGDANFIELLHNIRVGNVDSYADDILKIRFAQQPDKLYPYVASDDILAWQIGINGNNIAAGSNKWVSIKREETSIYINKFEITSPAIRQS